MGAAQPAGLAILVAKVQVLDSRGQRLSDCPRERAQKLVTEGQAQWLDDAHRAIRLQRAVSLPEPTPPPDPRTLLGKKVLLHICCAPCATYTVAHLRHLGAEVTGFWYNPNIHPYGEHERRRESLLRYADEIALPMIWEPGYEMVAYFRAVVGHETFGERCRICYRQRLERTAQRASELGMDRFSTTLLISPYQDLEAIQAIGQSLNEGGGAQFYYENMRRGFSAHHSLAREHDLYQQRFCGCLYSEWESRDRNASTHRRPDRDDASS